MTAKKDSRPWGWMDIEVRDLFGPNKSEDDVYEDIAASLYFDDHTNIEKCLLDAEELCLGRLEKMDVDECIYKLEHWFVEDLIPDIVAHINEALCEKCSEEGAEFLMEDGEGCLAESDSPGNPNMDLYDHLLLWSRHNLTAFGVYRMSSEDRKPVDKDILRKVLERRLSSKKTNGG